jgi:hypothetical protein
MAHKPLASGLTTPLVVSLPSILFAESTRPRMRAATSDVVTTGEGKAFSKSVRSTALIG